jgi:hypothetical protein
MYPKNMFFASESVTEGHSDEFCDQVRGAVLDGCLKHEFGEPPLRVAGGLGRRRVPFREAGGLVMSNIQTKGISP